MQQKLISFKSKKNKSKNRQKRIYMYTYTWTFIYVEPTHHLFVVLSECQHVNSTAVN